MSRIRLAVGVATAAVLVAAAALFVAAEREPWRALTRALRHGHYQPVAGRLAILDTRPASEVTRSAAIATSEQPLDIAAKAYAVLASTAGNRRKAVAALLIAKPADAEQLLRAIPERDRDGGYWNDLAVVLAAKGSAGNDETVIEALAAADRALDDAGSAEAQARFNRAMIVERLGLQALARSAYDRYLEQDSTSAWSAEARYRRAKLHSGRGRAEAWERAIPSLLRAGAAGDRSRIAAAAADYPEYARRWAEAEFLSDWAEATSHGDATKGSAMLALSRVIADTLRQRYGEGLLAGAIAAVDRASEDPAKLAALVSAHRLYRDASRLNGARQTMAAAAIFEKARSLFEFGSSPMALMARHFLASAAVDVGDHARALAILDALQSDAPADFHFLHAQMARLRATILSFNGLFEAALSSHRVAQTEFMTIGEVPSAIEMTGRMAGALTHLGRANEAWPILRSSLAAAGNHGDSRVVQSVLHSAAFVALSERRWEFAHALLNLEIEGGGVDTRLAEAAIWRVLAAERGGLTKVVSFELESARHTAAAVADPNFREGAENEVRLTEALLTGNESPQRARALLTEYLAVTQRRGRRTRVPDVLVARAALSKRLERFDEAESDLRQAVQMIEERRHRVERDFLRDTFLGKSSSAYAALADLLDSRGDSVAALAAADLPRARMLLDHDRTGDPTKPLDIGTVAAHLPASTALVAFAFFEERTITYVITARGLERIATSIPSRDIEGSIDRFTEAIDGGDDQRAKTEGKWLYSALIAPARRASGNADHFLMVDDPLLAKLPFSSLVGPDGRFLIEDATVAITPSIRAFVAAPARRAVSLAQTLLSVGNPSIDADRYPTLPSLRAAEQEAREVAALYDKPTLLISDRATKSRIMAALRSVEVAHLATHAISDSVDPEKSRLLIAPADGKNDALMMGEIAAMDLHGLDTVVVAGCRTATPGHAYGYVRSLSSAFLAAGAKHVVASLWDVEDEAGREFSVAFHHALRSGVDPTDAVRRVQLQMMRSSNPRFNKLAAWSAMQLYGSGR